MTIIRDREMYHGAALTQIADHDMFTSINRLPLEVQFRSAYRVNSDIGVFLKYSASPDNGEYMFTFSQENLDDIDTLNIECNKTFIVLVCYDEERREHSQICSITHFQLSWLKGQRDTKNRELRRNQEGQIALYVRVRPNGVLRAFVKNPEQRGRSWYYDVKRDEFPGMLFG